MAFRTTFMIYEGPGGIYGAPESLRPDECGLFAEITDTRNGTRAAIAPLVLCPFGIDELEDRIKGDPFVASSPPDAEVRRDHVRFWLMTGRGWRAYELEGAIPDLARLLVRAGGTEVLADE